MGDGNNFYNMDDKYIEEKYVMAEERRQQEEEARKRQREADQARALAEAERQRVAADNERRRKQAEEAEKRKLEEKQERLVKIAGIRKKKQEEFEANKKGIAEEREANIERQKELTTELETLVSNAGVEETRLQKEVDDLVEQKRLIQQKEDRAREELANYKTEMDMKKNTALAGLKQVDERFKELQAQNQKLLHDHLAFVDMNEEQVLQKEGEKNQPVGMNPGGNQAPPTSSGIPPYQPQPQPTPQLNPGSYPQTGALPHQPYPQQPQPQPGYQPGFPQPSAPMQPQPQPWAPPTQQQPMMPTWQQPNPQPSQPQPAPNQQPWGMNPNPTPAPNRVPAQEKSKNDLQDRLGTLDDLFRQGVLSKEEYEANKKEALRAAGMPVDSTGNPAVDNQLKQLEEFKNAGALSQSDYESAKKKILEDAKKNPPPQPSTTNTAPMALPQGGGTTQVAVVVPPNRNPGDSLRITYQGKNYDVVIPPGMRPGQQFHAAIPV